MGGTAITHTQHSETAATAASPRSEPCPTAPDVWRHELGIREVQVGLARAFYVLWSAGPRLTQRSGETSLRADPAGDRGQ